MCEAFERAIITHCAPTLAGHKCGSLFSFRGCSKTVHAECMEAVNAALGGRGVRVCLLKECERGCLVYLYRPAMLEKRLSDPAVRAFLAESGYADPLRKPFLEQLSERIGCGKDFPHEIGVFLDYPLDDVIGFIRHHGNNYCCLGCWKAYSNEQEARRRFALYRKCRDVYLSCYRRGFGVARLTVAA